MKTSKKLEERIQSHNDTGTEAQEKKNGTNTENGEAYDNGSSDNIDGTTEKTPGTSTPEGGEFNTDLEVLLCQSISIV